MYAEEIESEAWIISFQNRPSYDVGVEKYSQHYFLKKVTLLQCAFREKKIRKDKCSLKSCSKCVFKMIRYRGGVVVG